MAKYQITVIPFHVTDTDKIKVYFSDSKEFAHEYAISLSHVNRYADIHVSELVASHHQKRYTDPKPLVSTYYKEMFEV